MASDQSNPPPEPTKQQQAGKAPASTTTAAATKTPVTQPPPTTTQPAAASPAPASPAPASPAPASPASGGINLPGHQLQQPSGIVPAGPDDVHEEDEFELTDGYETASAGSTSVTSSVYAHTIENGRRYQHFKNGRYPIPNDDTELMREDMKHVMMMELCDGQLFYAPIGEHPQKILDIGTGTGIWAIEVGDRFPNARVRGIDISPVQPVWVPPNVDFLVDDCEGNEWLDKDCDLVHFRFTAAILKNVSKVLRYTYESLKPGGWVELQEFSADVLCDDSTMPNDDPVKYTYDLCQEAFTKFGMNITISTELESYLRDAGFVNIQCIVKKVPIGPWARDKTLRVIGMYQKLAVQDILPALSGRPMAALGMTPLEAEVTVAHARKALEDMTVHRYFHYYFWFAQKPK
ncbi:hypothetical protein VTJ83DRAFT_4487 [Remersonia thermophila]|uniref:Methyltransferase domain-containing protein n=1 Tax=Remersonia thermophila TaxID=72144 RepID=A0ABR4DAW0_9PEZI